MTGIRFIALIGEGAEDELFNQNYPEWIAESYGASGLGVAGFAALVLFGGALGLFNWTESFKPPVVWLALMTPIVSAALPVPVVMRVAGIITTGVALLFLGLWSYWRRMG
jgi:hypothetical protein